MTLTCGVFNGSQAHGLKTNLNPAFRKSFFSVRIFVSGKETCWGTSSGNEQKPQTVIHRNLQQVLNKNIIVIKVDTHMYEEKQNVERKHSGRSVGELGEERAKIKSRNDVSALCIIVKIKVLSK